MSEGQRRQTKGKVKGAVWIRLIGSPLILGLVFGVLWICDRWGTLLPLDIALVLVGGAATAEMVQLLRGANRNVSRWIPIVAGGLLAGVGLFAPAIAPDGSGLRFEVRTLIVAGSFLALLLRYMRDVRPETVERIALSVMPVLFVGLLFSWMRELATGDRPAFLLAWVVLVAKASDMGGWLVGKPFGRHKMIPSVSPGKSWEGLVGGLLGSVLVAVLLPPLLKIQPVVDWSALHLALFGVAVGGASVMAGVFWSGWKRRLGAKDSSTLIPEMGGLIDMIDSMLVAAPVAWLWFRLVA